MQRLDKYGLVTLVFLLVTFVAVVVWGDGHADKLKGLFVSPGDTGQLLAGADARPAPARPERAGQAPARGTPLRLTSKADATLRRPPLSTPSTVAGANASPRGGARRELPKRAERPERLARTEPAERRSTGAPSTTAGGAATDPPRGRAEDQRPTPQPSLQRYVVQAGDTLSEIAQAELGSSRRWREILELNPGLDAAHLHVGQRLELPPRQGPAAAPTRTEPRPERAAPQPAATSGTYVVQAGDTLSDIALRELGSAQRWRSIVDANPGLKPERLFVGQSIRLPGGAPSKERATSSSLVASAPKAPSRRGSKVQ